MMASVTGLDWLVDSWYLSGGRLLH